MAAIVLLIQKLVEHDYTKPHLRLKSLATTRSMRSAELGRHLFVTQDFRPYLDKDRGMTETPELDEAKSYLRATKQLLGHELLFRTCVRLLFSNDSSAKVTI